MNKRELFNQIVAEVEEGKSLITIENQSYQDVVQGERVQLRMPKEGVFLKSDTSAFAEYAVRDALIMKGLEDEQFTFVLVNKIGSTLKAKEAESTVTQDDIEAFATVGNLLVMWEQFGGANMIIGLLESMVEDYSLELPQLVELTKRMIIGNETFPFAEVRKNTVERLGEKVQEGLDN